jgi:uncharacterized glyoxalase superfamily protein PhnB
MAEVNMNVKLTNICPIFVSANVADTVKYYVEVLGFTFAEHFDKIESFATVYRDSIEIVIVQKRKGQIESNDQRYGAGYDAYIDTDTIEGVRIIHDELRLKGVKILTPPHMQDYGSFEFTFADIDGRIIGIGLISDKEKYFKRSNHL